jgi:hypothetical protein
MEKIANPVALATAASSKEGQKAIGQITTAAKVALLVGGGLLAANFAWKKFKEFRADKYIRDNIGNPNLIAAGVIHNSFLRLTAPGVFSLFFPEINISTDEDQLNIIANNITNVKAVSDAYKIMFDRNLGQDVQSGLDSEELQRFWNLLNSTQNNETSTLYPLGSELYVADRNGILVNKAEKINNRWIGTNLLYGNFERNEFVGKVIAHGVIDESIAGNSQSNLIGENYYIVRKTGWCYLTSCDTGVVIQEQITNKEV